MSMTRIFISSVQKELAAERQALKECTVKDALKVFPANTVLRKQGMFEALLTGRAGTVIYNALFHGVLQGRM